MIFRRANKNISFVRMFLNSSILVFKSYLLFFYFDRFYHNKRYIAMEKRCRKALTDTDRLMIRKRNKSCLSAYQQELTDWFTKKTGHLINQGTISKIFAYIYDYIDNITKRRDKKELLQRKRYFARDWPALKAALFEWQQRIKAKKAIITGDMLKEKAHQLWLALP